MGASQRLPATFKRSLAMPMHRWYTVPQTQSLTTDGNLQEKPNVSLQEALKEVQKMKK